MGLAVFMLFIGAIFLVVMFVWIACFLIRGIMRLLQIAINCVVIYKGEGNWWKGLIPFYSRYVKYHLAFNHKTAVLVFIVDMVVLAILGGLITVSTVMSGVSDAVASNSGYYTTVASNPPTSFDSLVTLVGLTSMILSGIMFLVRIASSLIYRFATYALCKSFGRETGFCVCAFFFPVITSAIVAFGPDEYCEYLTEILHDSY